MTLTGNGLNRSAVTDTAGRFVFDDLDIQKLYAVRAELSGFDDAVREGVALRAGETVAVDLALREVCLPLGTLDHVVYPALDMLLMADAVVHLRIAETGHTRLIETYEYCRQVVEAPAEILDVVRVSRDEWRSRTTIALTTDDSQLEAGAEYLAFLSYNASTQQFGIDEAYSWKITRGRVERQAELGIPDGTPTARAVSKLREMYQRHSRYRSYDDLSSNASLGTLQYKTGWFALGTLRLDREEWTDGSGRAGTRPFDFVATLESSRMMPRPTDRIRLKEGGSDHHSRLRLPRRSASESIIDGAGRMAMSGFHFHAPKPAVSTRWRTSSSSELTICGSSG